MKINYNNKLSDSSDSDPIEDNPIIHKDIDENLRTENYAEENKRAPIPLKHIQLGLNFRKIMKNLTISKEIIF